MFGKVQGKMGMMRKMCQIIIILALTGALFFAVPQAHATGPCFVKQSAGGLNNGSSWTNAFTNLQTALGTPACTEIWVAAGVYKPGASRTNTFNIKSGLLVYGGFVGTETLLGQRNPTANITILSGDIDSNDTNSDGNQIAETYNDIQGNNSYNIVSMNWPAPAQMTASTVLDGFTITGGKANGNPAFPFEIVGGGLVCHGALSGQACNPTLSNLNFSGNFAENYGGAVFNSGWNGE